MVKRSDRLGSVFHALADRTRRDILRRVAKRPLTIGEIAASYAMTFAAISKHLAVLEDAKLVMKRHSGRERLVELSPAMLRDAASYLERYEALWSGRLDRLETYLKDDN